MPAIPVVPGFSVAAQLDPSEAKDLAAAGVKTIICNRPEGEVDPAPMRRAAEAAGLGFRYVPVISGGMTMDDVEEMGRALAETEGPHVAYCRSGTRSVTVWALAEAGRRSPDALIAAAAEAGYDLRPMRGALEARATAARRA